MRLLAIGDLHTPFHHEHAFDFLRDLKREFKPEAVVNLGDELDAHGWSRHDRSPDAPGQKDELRGAKGHLKTLAKLFPKMKICTSNHSSRHLRKAVRAGLPSDFIRELRDVLDAPVGWEWSDEWIVDGTLFIHGEGYSGQNSALAAARANRCNTVIGHVHAWAGVQYHVGPQDQIWGMNVGCLVNAGSIAMEYAKKNANRQMLSSGIILDGVPTVVPMTAEVP
jgi:hypothetical protein